MTNLRTTLCFFLSFTALCAAGCSDDGDRDTSADGTPGADVNCGPSEGESGAAESGCGTKGHTAISGFDLLAACEVVEPCQPATTQLIENRSRNIEAERARCVLQGLRDRTPGRYQYDTDHTYSNGSVGAHHLLVVLADGSVMYGRDEYGPGVASEQPAQRCQLADSSYFASCLAALGDRGEPDALVDEVDDAAWACLFGAGSTTEPSRLAWLTSCAAEAPRCE